MSDIIIELMGEEVSICLGDGSDVQPGSALARDLADCCTSGDCKDACEYVAQNYSIAWRIVAPKIDESGYENRDATPAEKQAVAESIYFESDSDFSDETRCETYLIWEVANYQESI